MMVLRIGWLYVIASRKKLDGMRSENWSAGDLFLGVCLDFYYFLALVVLVKF